MKELVFKVLLLLFFSMTGGSGFGQSIENPSGFEIVEDDINVLIKSKANHKTFNVLKNSPYRLNFLKDNTPEKNGYCPRYDYEKIDIKKLIRNYPLLKIDHSYKFDFASVEFNYSCGLNFTLVAYSVGLYKRTDNEGSAVAQKSIFSFVVLDKNLKTKWRNNVELFTDNINEFTISYNGNYFIKKGQVFENNQEKNQIFLYSFLDNRILYDFLPDDPIESRKYELFSFGATQKLSVVLDKNDGVIKHHYFNVNDKSIYERLPASNNQSKIPLNDLEEEWDSKNLQLNYYQRTDKKKAKVVRSFVSPQPTPSCKINIVY
jgi:hypothetical protein